jgi:polar amino acid transport system substrate-binding protein
MTMHPTRRTLLAALGCAALCTEVRADAPTTREMRLACNPDFTSEVNALVLRELYQRAGIRLTVIEMPPARGTVEAKEGRVDGEVNRIRGYGDNAPTLIRVEPSIHLWSVSALFKKGSAVRVQTAADLSRYSVGYVRGIRFAEDLVKGLSNTVATDNPEQLVRMLQNGRIDLVVNGTNATRYEMRALGLTDEIDSSVLTQTPLYHYLHEKHRDLVPVIGAVIKKAADSGELEKLFARYEKQLLDAAGPAK